MTFGVKLALTPQECLLPETAIILQMSLPTGADAFSADEVLPGVNYLYAWDLNWVANRLRERFLSPSFMQEKSIYYRSHANQSAALVGVAPYNRDSGRKSRQLFICGGRPDVRSIFYMTTLTATRYNPVIREMYQRLLKVGKKESCHRCLYTEIAYHFECYRS